MENDVDHYVLTFIFLPSVSEETLSSRDLGNSSVGNDLFDTLGTMGPRMFSLVEGPKPVLRDFQYNHL